MRRYPLFTLAVGCAPLENGNDLASGSTLSRRENSDSRKNIYRLAKSFVDAFIASYADPPAVIVPDRDHSEAATRLYDDIEYQASSEALARAIAERDGRSSPKMIELAM